ncbi:hypothetical protein CBM2634_U10021 [Cupriavidus taiwanensis]|uniref:Uncharacterized protein n=1 Tax=Cupriavidus taiwanensis TaxID=164546 RepID=A0A375JE66_9BURK|nr:hypothetical protein CBM2634_U10021 [Cupriavidus taiwanensis]
MGESEDACKTWLGWNARPQLMAVCNKGTLLGWTVIVGNEQNEVLHLFKRSSKTTT